MDNIFAGSVPSLRSELDLGSIPSTDISVLQSEFHKYFPISNIKDSSNPIEFVLPSSTNHYLDLMNSFCYIRCRITQINGDKLTATQIVAPGHGFFSAMFDSLEITMNSTVVSKSAQLYSYRGHILNLLTHGNGYKSTILGAEMYYPDDKQDTFNESENKGFKTRLNFAKLSTPFELLGKFSESVFSTDRYFPPGIETRISLRRSSPEFSLTGASIGTAAQFPFKVVIDECIFYAKQHICHPQVVAQHQKILSSGKHLQYPLRTIEMRTFSIAKGTQSVLSETLFRNYLPEFLVITFVKSKAINGSVVHSCFNFQPSDIDSVIASVDGDATIYRQLKFDTQNNVSLLGYNTLQTAIPESQEGHGISRSEYIDGSFLVVLDIQPSNIGNRFQSKRRGQTTVELRFKKPLEDSLNCIVMGQFEGLLSIDNHRNVLLDTI